MKKTAFYLTILFLILIAVDACKKMDHEYRKFIVPGGITYPGKASSVMAYPGHNRVKISWLGATDPSVVKARIFWDNYTDSVEVNLSSKSDDTVSVMIDNLPEKSYSFMIKTYDAKGNASVPVEVISAAYGDQYQASLLNRPVISNILGLNDTVTIQWGIAAISNGAVATEVKYTDTLGTSRIQQFPITESSSVIKDIKPGTVFLHRTVFIPDSLSIDTFYTRYTKDSLFLLDKSNWSIIDYSTEYPRADTRVTRIIDGNTTTRWHTWKGHTSYPEFVTVDMKVERKITYFEIWRDNGDVRACDTFQLFVSNDNVTWTDLGVFPFDRFTDVGQWYEIPSHPKARYWKFVGLSGPENYMVMGEISVYGY